MKREEAINEIKSWGFINEEEMEVLATLIPELREGDSDRIRKEIISALKWANHRGVYDEHIAYLENLKPSFRKIHDGVMWDRGLRTGIELGKQKSQKPWGWSEEEEKILDSIIDDYEKAARSFCGYDGKIGLLRAIRDGEYNLPKPAWSEEDRLHYANILEALEYVKGCKSDYDKIEAIKSDIAWFKSIRPQPKQETE